MVEHSANDEAIPRLPNDLYREIIQHVASNDDLYNLSHSSRALQSEAEYHLYRHVNSSCWTRTEDLCDLLIRCGRLQPYVRSISLTNEGMKLPPTLEYWYYVAKLLMNLPNLESLKICNGSTMANSNAWVLDSCIASLRKIDVDFELDSHLIDFLHDQPRLQQVQWINSSRDESDVSAAVFQSLQSPFDPQRPRFLPTVTELMTNSVPFALHLVNTCSISHLWICGHVYENAGGVQYLSQFNRNALSLRSLRLNFPVRKITCIAMLEELAQQAPNLRSIGFLPYFDATQTDLLSALANFKQLRSVVTWRTISSDTSRLLAQMCPSLRLVACLHYSYSHEYVFLPVNPLGTPRPMHDPDFLLWRDA